MPSGSAIEQPSSSDRAANADTALILAARSGDVKAFEQLYRLHVGRVLGICLRMTRRRDLAEDCTQQTFVRAWRNLGAFEGRSAFGTWLHRIAVNEVLTYSRNHGTRLEAETQGTNDEHLDTEAAQGTLPAPGAMGAGDVMDVERALATLPEGSRHVVVLQAIYGYSHEEVAEMLGIAVGTAKAQLHRGRRMLRERLGLGEFEP